MTRYERFRAGVGMLVVNRQGLVLVGQRTSIVGAWQAPQGGVAKGEEPIDAGYRELAEELEFARSDVELLAEYPEWLAYELPPGSRTPKTGRGQVQKWFLFRFVGRDQDIDVLGAEYQEFDAWQWWPMQRLVENAWDVRRPIYEQLAGAWSEFFGVSADEGFDSVESRSQDQHPD